MRTLLLATVAVMAFAFTSCNDDKDDSTPAATGRTALLSKSWTLQSITAGGQSIIDFLDSCDRDNLTIFKTDGGFEINDVGIICDSAGTGGPVTTGRWFFSNGENQITIIEDNPADTARWDIENLTSNQLKISYMDLSRIEATYTLQ